MNKKVVWLPYDFDTAIGINNEGTLSYGYSLEDIDQVNGRDVYNGQDSVLWVNLRACFGSEIQSMYRSLRSSGAISYEKVKKLFEDHQAVWPEALRNEDSFFKYIQPLLEDGDDNYLSMLQGSKKEQRKWWLYNRIKYLDSKYNAGEAQTDRIQLRGYAKANITIRPYADIYATIKFGSYTVSQRATRNQDYTLVCPIDTLNDTEIYIYSSSQLSSVGDLSGLKTGFADFHLATKLTELILGSADPNYENGNLRRVTAGNLPLLKKLDVRNCTGLGLAHAEGESPQLSVDLSGCTNIEEVYFGGTGIRGVDLPNGGVLRILDLPGSITNLTIRNQTSLTTLTCPDYSNISTLWLEGMGDVMSLSDITNIVDSVTSGCRIRLFNFYWNFNSIADVQTFLAKFDGMIGVNQNGDNVEHPQIYAHVHVPTATGDQIDAINADWPDVVVDADVMTVYLRYWNYEGTTIIYTESVAKNGNGAYSGHPSHETTQGYDYTFAGWSLYKNSNTADASATQNLTGNRDVYAAYTLTAHLYTATFVRASADGGGTLYTQTGLRYGTTPTYNGATPTTTAQGDWSFGGWNPALGPITADTTYTAVFVDMSSNVIKYLKGTLENYVDTTNTMIAQYAFYSYDRLKTVTTSASIIQNMAFYNCGSLDSIHFTSTSGQMSFGNSTFELCFAILEVVISNNDSVVSTTSNTFTKDVFAQGPAVIYVPDEIVNSYKSSTQWTDYKDRIISMSSYPIADLSTVSDSWDTIIAAAADGTHATKYVKGKSIKKLEYGNTFIYMQYIGDRPEGPIWAVLIMNEKRKYHNVNANLDYKTTDLDAYINNTLYNQFPSNLKNAIAEIPITYWDGTSEQTINRKVWLLSSREVNLIGSYLKETNGYTFSDVFTSSLTSKIRYQSNSRTGWWLRSFSSHTSPFYIQTTGSISSNLASYTNGILFAFCLRNS